MRNAIVVALLLLVLPGAALAQNKTTDPGGTPGNLTPDEYERFVKRVDGTWILNRSKSTLMSGEALDVPEGFIYKVTPDRKGVHFTRGQAATIFQTLDGKPSGTTSTIARVPLDEFTLENISGNSGRRTIRTTQFYSPDGTKVVYIKRRVDAQGVETPLSVVLYERVPEGTPIPPDTPQATRSAAPVKR